MSAAPIVAGFEAQRRQLTGLAYRMLGSWAEAEDIVQEAWLRWHDIDLEQVEQPRAYLSQAVTRLCLDRLKSAQAQREVYVGPWLPEPLLDEAGHIDEGPAAASELASDLSFAFLLALERLSPLERAAFLLHDVFDMDFAAVAAAVNRSEAACRQLAKRARTHLRDSRPRFDATPEQQSRLATVFLATAQSGDLAALTRMLADDARFIADGGGRVTAARRPVLGATRVAALLSGLVRNYWPLPGARLRTARINGLAGFVISDAGGKTIQTIAVEFRADGLVSALYIMRNPDKLRHLDA